MFLGINILMGIKPLPSYRDYWSSSPDLHDDYLSKLMSVNRFGWLLSHIHLNDNNLMPGRDQPNYDKLYKLRPFLNINFKKFWKMLCTTTKTSCSWIYDLIQRSEFYQAVLSKKKTIKRGYKVWCLADQSGDLYRFAIYTGKVGDKTEKNLGERVVKE